jgi:hypothetical protein
VRFFALLAAREDGLRVFIHDLIYSRHKEGKLGERGQNREKEGLEPAVQVKQGKEGSEKKGQEQ